LDDKYALVLGGGGANCSYQLGAWKAFREKNIQFEAIIGTSGGAVNGAFIAQNDWDLAWDIWSNLTIDGIVDIPPELFKNGRLRLSMKNISSVTKLSLLKNRGLDTRPFRQMLKANVDEERIRKSGINLGIVTYQLTDLKSAEIFIDEIESGMLEEYIMASAAFPMFKKTEIGDKWFIDGGIYNNVPFSIAKDRGYKNIIVVEVSAIGRVKRPDVAGTNTIYIRNSKPLGRIMDFNPSKVESYFDLGYMDTLRVLGDLSGMDYFFKVNPGTFKDLDAILRSNETAEEFATKLQTEDNPEEDFIKSVRNVLPKEKRNHHDIILALAESAATSLKLDDRRIWDFDKFVALVWKTSQDVDVAKSLFSAGEYKQFFNMIAEKSDEPSQKSKSGPSALEYDRAMSAIFGKSLNSNHVKKLESYFPYLLPAKIFISILSRYFSK
jgi:NTE family protein